MMALLHVFGRKQGKSIVKSLWPSSRIEKRSLAALALVVFADLDLARLWLLKARESQM